MQAKKKIEYFRLSKADGDVVAGTSDMSDSIAAQKLCVDRFVKEHPDIDGDFEEIVDDGYTGTNMQRPGMQKLLNMVWKGQADTVIVRDLSRFARNYLEAGYYLEFFFPVYNVRFISINDNYDSISYNESTGGLELAIRNLINQMYSHDISKKIKSAVDIKKLAGEFVYGTAPYGYKKGETRNTIVVDPDVAPIVKRIFSLAAEGVTVTQIAQRLNKEKIATPSVYLSAVRGKYKTVDHWTYESVRNILRNRIYTGDTVPFKSHVIRVGSNRVKQIPEEQQTVIPNTHEAIVSRGLYYQAVMVIKSNVKHKREDAEKYAFTSLLICGCCGNRLIKGKKSNKYWRCATGRYTSELGCNRVKIREDVLENIVLNAIRNLCRLVDGQIEESYKIVNQGRMEEKEISASVRKLKNKSLQMQKKKMELFEEYMAGKIKGEGFMREKEGLTKQISDIQAELEEKEKELAMILAQRNTHEEVETRAKQIKQYDNITKLTPELLKELVQKIIVEEGRIKIIWKFSDICEGVEETTNSPEALIV